MRDEIDVHSTLQQVSCDLKINSSLAFSFNGVMVYDSYLHALNFAILAMLSVILHLLELILSQDTAIQFLYSNL